MSTRTSKLHLQCQRLWLAAFQAPQTLRFKTKTETERAKFTLYDAVRAARREGKGSEELVKAALNCEICLAPDKLSLIVQNRMLNNFVGGLMKQMEEAVGEVEGQEQAATPDPPEIDIAASLAKLAGMTDQVGKMQPTSNPYYTREGGGQ